jgi:CrcB protein
MSATLLAAIAAVLVGGCASVLRYLVSVVLAGRTALPLAVLVVNVVGSAIGGAVLGASHSGALSADARLVILGGLAGGLTTFSTWSVETIELVQRGKWGAAFGSVALNLVLGITAAAACWALTR